MADRQEFQQERTRLLRDPEAGDDTQIADAAGEGFGVAQETDEPTEAELAEAGLGPEVRADREANPEAFLARPEVEVTAAIVDEGIEVTFLIPHGLIGVALSQ